MREQLSVMRASEITPDHSSCFAIPMFSLLQATVRGCALGFLYGALDWITVTLQDQEILLHDQEILYTIRRLFDYLPN